MSYGKKRLAVLVTADKKLAKLSEAVLPGNIVTIG
jgi:hypothetical protein